MNTRLLVLEINEYNNFISLIKLSKSNSRRCTIQILLSTYHCAYCHGCKQNVHLTGIIIAFILQMYLHKYMRIICDYFNIKFINSIAAICIQNHILISEPSVSMCTWYKPTTECLDDNLKYHSGLILPNLLENR